MFEELKIAKYRFTLKAGERGLDLPEWKASTFRGGFGYVFKNLTCAYKNRECKGCPIQHTCPYIFVFETKSAENSKIYNNFESVPRPYVLITPFDEKTNYRPGESLQFELLLLGKAIQYIPYFIKSFELLGDVGIGKGRKSFQLTRVEQMDLKENMTYQIYDEGSKVFKYRDISISGDDIIRRAAPISSDSLTILFKTPLRIKYQGKYTDNPQFHLIMRNIVRRISSSLYFHHGSEAAFDVVDLIRKAEKVTVVHKEVQWKEWDRYSARQQTHMALGGLFGEASYYYEGGISEFAPWLSVGEIMHIGKQTAFGLGQYQLVWG